MVIAVQLGDHDFLSNITVSQVEQIWKDELELARRAEWRRAAPRTTVSAAT